MLSHVATSRARRAPSDGGFGAHGGSHEGPLFAPDLGYEAFAAAQSAATLADNAANAASAASGTADGSLTNGKPQGQCFADIVAGVVKSIDVPMLAGTVAADLLRGAPIQAIVADAAIEITITGLQGGVQAAKDSEACRVLDNAHEAKILGVSAITGA